MEDPDWATVLQAIYRSNNGEIFWPLEDDKMDQTIEETDLTQEEEDRAISYLHEIGLLEHANRDRGRPRELTQKGFDVAHEREMRNKQQALIERQSKAIESQSDVAEEQADATDTLADFTIILGVAALIQALAAVISLPRYRIHVLTLYGIILIVLWYKKDGFHTVKVP